MRLRRFVLIPVTAFAVLAPATATPAVASTPGYALLRTTTHVVIRWNPCKPVHYRLSLAHAPRGAMADVKAAIARLHKATGLSFVFDGQTSTIPQASYGTTVADPTHPPPLLIAWAAPGTGKGRSNALLKADAGVGGPGFDQWLDRNGDFHPLQIVTGIVVLNDLYNKVYRPGFGSGYTRGEVLLHELGHAVGLQHVADPRQIMYPAAIARTKAEYGKGDLAGLSKVGRKAGCIKVKPFTS